MLSTRNDANSTKAFFGTLTSTIADWRLWLIVIVALAISTGALFFFSTAIAGSITFVVTLLAARLINQIDELPKIDGENVYRLYILPAAVGILLLGGSELFVRIWSMWWHWSHSAAETPSCSSIMYAAAAEWAGLIFATTVTSAVTGRRAMFAVMVGAAVYLPLTLSEALRHDVMSATASILVQSCHLDPPDASDYDAMRVGLATSMIVRAFLIVFVARFVSAWIVRDACTPIPVDEAAQPHFIAKTQP